MTALLQFLKSLVARQQPDVVVIGSIGRMPNTARGFEVTGRRRTPPVPSSPTLTELLEGRQWRAA